MNRLLLFLLMLLMVRATWADVAADAFDALYDSIMIRDASDYREWQKVMGGHVPVGETVGQDAVSPLIWRDSRYLIEGDTHARFTRALDQFSALSDEEIEALPDVKRAIMQRHLWALFDWSVELTRDPPDPMPAGERRAQTRLQRRLAAQIRRLALSEAQISQLPATLTATGRSGEFPESYDPGDHLKPFFPRDLEEEDGPWVCLGNHRQLLLAERHSEANRWRSVFRVFVRLPGDREETLAYLEKLSTFREPWTTVKQELSLEAWIPSAGSSIGLYINPETPQFPAGTQFALVEQAFLISDAGELVVSPLTNSVQLRAYMRVDPEDPRNDLRHRTQAFAEFEIQPREYMRGKAGMRAIGLDEHRYKTWSSRSDLFEGPGRGANPRLDSCMVCHAGWGIHSVNIRSQKFVRSNLFPPQLNEVEPESASRSTVMAKEKDYSWGVLQALWPDHETEPGRRAQRK
ncbi:MAG: hypothetical protein ACR2RV_01655 [Verrucomicrobiales bacterium]